MRLIKTEECWEMVKCPYCEQSLEVDSTHEWGAEANAMSGSCDCPNCSKRLFLGYEIKYYIV